MRRLWGRGNDRLICGRACCWSYSWRWCSVWSCLKTALRQAAMMRTKAWEANWRSCSCSSALSPPRTWSSSTTGPCYMHAACLNIQLNFSTSAGWLIDSSSTLHLAALIDYCASRAWFARSWAWPTGVLQLIPPVVVNADNHLSVFLNWCHFPVDIG